jgi:hypothetical protein
MKTTAYAVILVAMLVCTVLADALPVNEAEGSGSYILFIPITSGLSIYGDQIITWQTRQ